MNIQMEAPGFGKNDFTISVDNGLLMISADQHGTGYMSFSRSINLPADTREEDINARYQGGILELSIVKSRYPQVLPGRRIEIQ